MKAQEDPKRSTDDAGFARRIAGIYAPPPMGAASRARFDAALAERLSGRVQRATRRLAGLAATAAAVAVLALIWLPLQQGTGPPRAGSGGGEMILALALSPDADLDVDLPDDYRAISALLAE
jgi:hypothetical protein